MVGATLAAAVTAEDGCIKCGLGTEIVARVTDRAMDCPENIAPELVLFEWSAYEDSSSNRN